MLALVAVSMERTEFPKPLGPSQLCLALPAGVPDTAISISLEAQG